MQNLPDLLFLPGLLCDEALWAHQCETLSDLAVPHIADLTRDDTIAAMAASAVADVDGPFILVALSMGGYVAFEILREIPDRVLAVALFDTTAAPDSPQKAAERRAGLASIRLGRFSGVTNRLLPQFVHPDHVHGPVGNAVRAMAKRVGSEAYVRQQTAILGRIDSRPRLGEIRVPALVAVGNTDQLTPVTEAELIHRGIPGSRLHVIERCGHLPPMERPEETSALLRDWFSGFVLPVL